MGSLSLGFPVVRGGRASRVSSQLWKLTSGKRHPVYQTSHATSLCLSQNVLRGDLSVPEAVAFPPVFHDALGLCREGTAKGSQEHEYKGDFWPPCPLSFVMRILFLYRAVFEGKIVF